MTPKFDEKESSVSGNIEEDKNTAKNTTEDADKNSGDNEIIRKYEGKVVTIEDESNTLEYQETMNLDIENISSTNQKNWRSIYEGLHDDYFKAVKLFPTQFLDHCKKIKLKTYQMKSKQILKR